MRNDTIDILFFANHAYALSAAVLVSSVLRTTSDKGLRFLVADCGLDADDWRRMERLIRRSGPGARLVRIPAQHAVQVHDGRIPPLPGQINRAAFDLLVPTDCERLLLLDTDLLIAADLRRLMDVPLEGHWMAAVRDFGYPTLGDFIPEAAERLGVSPGLPYLNFGVTVIDMRLWRDNGLARVRDNVITQAGLSLKLIDQDCFALLAADGWKALDFRWNAQMIALQHIDKWPVSDLKTDVLSQMPALIRQPFIFHYAGPYKPWNPNPGCRLPGQSRYLAALLTSGWFDFAEGIRWLAGWTRQKWLP